MSAFPVRIVQLDPANLGTADAAFFGEADNGAEYCIKTEERTPGVPAAEFICHTLADACGLAVPQFDVVELPDGSLGFGSVWDGSAASQLTSIQVLMGNSPGRQVPQSLSCIYAFDLLVNNVDRNLSNYLCVAGRTPGHTVKAYDFSRAFTANGWPLPSFPLPGSCKTLMVSRLLRSRHSFDIVAACSLIDRFGAIPFNTFQNLVGGLPVGWLDAKLRNALVKWWTTGRVSRCRETVEGLKNGTLL